MPYYEELFLNSASETRVPSSGSKYLVVRDSNLVRSFRSVSPKALAFREVPDYIADPYAYYLDSVSDRQYHEALRLRGLPEVGSPDRGHSFESVRHTVVSPDLGFSQGTMYEGVLYGYAGNGLDSVHTGNHLQLPNFGSDGLPAFAQQAYSRSAPTFVAFDLAEFLGELREGLPKLALETLKGKIAFYKGLGSDYLNTTFGWIPFVSDVQNAARTLARATSEFSQQGKRVHRRYSVPRFTNSQNTNIWGPYDLDVRFGLGFPFTLSGLPLPQKVMGYPLPLTSGSSGAEFNFKFASKTMERDRWFEGEFSSFLPLGFDPENFFSRFNALVNLKVTPDVLWELTPWSWLVDWQLHIEDTIRSNELAANDLLVMHYGYAMEKTVYKTESFMNSPSIPLPWFYYPSSAKMMVTTTRKRRIRANPYGFVLGGSDGLSAKQLLILGALGLTKI